MAFTPFTKEEQPTMANFNVKFLDAIQEAKTQALDAGVKIATGSYTGTGTYGSSNPNSLTFDFVPKLVFIQGGQNTAIIVRPETVSTSTFISCTLTNGEVGKFGLRFSSNTVYWYQTGSSAASSQFNTSGYIYYYIAIG